MKSALGRMHSLQVRLRVSLALAAVLIIVPLAASIVGYLFFRHSELALVLAAEAMDRETARVVEHVDALLDPVQRAVEATVAVAQLDRESTRADQALRYLYSMMQSLPQCESLYIGLAATGDFYQVLRIPPEIARLGPLAQKPPKTARYALRVIETSSGDRIDTFTYIASWGEVVGKDVGPTTYDPRARPWYGAAHERQGVAASEVYVFATTRNPGITLAQRMFTSHGVEIGTVGADVSLDAVSNFLAEQRIGSNGLVFVLDDEGRLIGHPNLGTTVPQRDNDIKLVSAQEADDPLVATTARLRKAKGSDRLIAEIKGEAYLASFTPLPEKFGRRWIVGVLATEDHFVGPLKRSTTEVLVFGCASLTVALALIIWGSRVLTRPIHQIIEETGRIRRMDLSGRFAFNSAIVEIDELFKSVEAMKIGLNSFGAYVPKSLVRMIIQSGETTQIGGERRKLSVLFTDISNFTHVSETLPPEAVLKQLSTYMEALSNCIHENGGTVDKFIGDAIMAFWNAPLADPDHVARACRAMLATRDVSRELNYRFESFSLPQLHTRFGLHAGEAVVGNVGSSERMQYTALGDTVNVASRIEGLNKLYGTQLLATDAVVELVREEFLFRKIDLVVPSGLSRGVEIHELLAPVSASAKIEFAWLADWDEALNAYRMRNWVYALDLLQRFGARHRADPVVTVYIERCRRYLLDPPPPEWDGAERLIRK
jgi:adenylate cyclase